MSNLTTKMIQISIEINGSLIFLKFGMVKLFESLHNDVDVENLLPQIKIFEQIRIYVKFIF